MLIRDWLNRRHVIFTYYFASTFLAHGSHHRLDGGRGSRDTRAPLHNQLDRGSRSFGNNLDINQTQTSNSNTVATKPPQKPPPKKIVPFPHMNFGGRGSRSGYTALEQDEQELGYNGQGGRGSSRGFNNGNGDRGTVNFGGDSGSSWRGCNNERYGSVNRGRDDRYHDRGRSDLGMYERNGKCTHQNLIEL